MIALIEKLSKTITENALRTGCPVCKLERNSDAVRVSVGELETEPRERFQASKVIIAMPPRLAAASILFDPEASARENEERRDAQQAEINEDKCMCYRVCVIACLYEAIEL
jgi:monoamine oxidase